VRVCVRVCVVYVNVCRTDIKEAAPGTWAMRKGRADVDDFSKQTLESEL
jgi:hypothetical protein